MADINVIASFKVNNPYPADAKYLVANEAGITALINAGNAYPGMLCYVESEKAVYIVKEDGTSFEPLLSGTAGEIGDLGDDIKELQDLHDKVGGDGADKDNLKTVAQEVTAGIEALDATVDSTGGDRVSVQVVEEDGKITAVTVAENDIAQKSELDKLIALHSKKEDGTYETVAEEVAKVVDGAPEALDTLKEIADWIANQDDNGVTDVTALVTRVDANTTAIGAKAVAAAEGVEAKAATGLYKYVDDAVAAANSSAEDAIEALDATVDSTGGTKVSVQVVEENGKITGVTVAEDDIASAALLGTATDDKTKATAFGAIAAEADARATAIDNLEADFTGDKAVSDTDGFVKVALKEEDGVITTLTVATTDIAKASELDALEAVVGTEAVTGENAADATGLIKDIRALEAKMGNTDVAAQITSAIQALDVDTYTSGVSSTDGKVTVGLTEADGKITALTVATDDIASASALGKLQTAVGISELAEGADSIDTRLQALETGDNSVATQIENAIDALEGEATSTEGTFVTVKVTTTDGEVTAVNVTESDIASATLLGETTDDKTKATAFGYIAAEADRATTAEGALSDRIGIVPAKVGETATGNVVAYVDAKVAAAASDANSDIEALEALHAKDGDNFKSVSDEIDDAIGALAGSATSTNGTLVNVTVTTADGEVSTVSVDDSALTTKIGDVPTKVGETAVSDVVGYVDAKVAAVNSAVEALDAEVTSADGTNVTVKVTQTDGKITAVNVTESDIASAQALADLQSVVGDNGPLAEGTKSHEERLDTLEGTGEGSVAKAVTDGIAAWVETAPDAFDTLQEIAAWIGSGDVENTTAATMLADLTALKTQVGKEAEGENAATGLVKNIRDLEAKVGTSSVADVIDGLDATVRAQLTTADAIDNEAHKVGVKIVETDGKLASVTVVENDIASAKYVGTIPTGATATTVVGYAAEVAAAEAAAAQGEADGRLTKLEAAHAAEGEGFKTVQAEAEAAIAAIASASKDNGDSDLVKVTVTTEAGSVKTVAVDDSKLDEVIGTKAKAESAEGVGDGEAATGLYKYIDDSVAAANNAATAAVEALDADKTSDDDAPVTVEVKQVNGAITDVVVTPNAYTTTEIDTIWDSVTIA